MNNLKIEYLKTKDLTPYEKNARKHADADLQTIMESIQKFGFDDPVGIWSDKNIIVEGHGRVIAAKRLGIKEVPCIRLDHLTDEERRAYALAHNKTAEMSEWDFEQLDAEIRELGGAGFDMQAFGFEIGDTEDMDAEEDEFDPEVPKTTNIKVGDLFQLGNHRLICGDSTDPEVVARVMDHRKADLLVTDPPYNVALGQNGGHKMRPSVAKQLHRRTDGLTIDNDSWENEQDFINFLIKAFTAANENLKPGGAFYIWYADTQALNFRLAAKGAGWQVRENLIWVKSLFALGRQDYQWQHEPCLYGWKDGASHYFVDDRTISTVYEDRPDFNSMKKEELKNMLVQIFEGGGIPTTVIHEVKPVRSELHPTMKPIKLIARLIRNSSRKGETVLDVFGGSGSTMIACEQLGRINRTVELDPYYCDVIIQRWEKATGQKAVKIE